MDITTESVTQRGGRYVTAQGNLNVLFVYVQFPDDNYLPSSPSWPKGGAPAYMNAIVDQVWSTTPSWGSFTDYFNQMSLNSLKLTGKAVSVITPHARSWYLSNAKKAPFIHTEVLQQLDATIDFAEFDN